MKSLGKVTLTVLLIFSGILPAGCGVSEEEYFRIYAELASSQAKVDELQLAYDNALIDIAYMQNEIDRLHSEYELVGDTPEITAQNIVRWYYRTHIYSEADSFVCRDMALDVWDMLKAHGIHSLIQAGNVKEYVQDITDINHVWVQAEVSPGKYLAVDPTYGCVIREKDNPLYYIGWLFNDPGEYKDSIIGGGRVYIPDPDTPRRVPGITVPNNQD